MNNAIKQFPRFIACAAILGGITYGAFAASPTPLPKAKPKLVLTPQQGAIDRFIVTYRTGSAPQLNKAQVAPNVRAAVTRAGYGVMSATDTARLPALDVQHVRRLAIGSDVVRISRRLDAAQATALMNQIAVDPSVARVEIDRKMYPIRDLRMSADAPVAVDDAYYTRYQWHLREGDGTPATVGGDTASFANLGGMNAAKAWNYADGDGVVVAVLDTGITQHPDIDLSLADAGYDFISTAYVSGRETDGRAPGGWDLGDWTDTAPWNEDYSCVNENNPPSTSSWHGTHVAGTIAELSNNGTGMAGVAYKAKVLPVRVLGHCGGYSSDIADGIVWASGGHVDGVPDNQHPAQVINMSLGGYGSCSQYDVTGQAIAWAISRGTTVVVAAGNSNMDASQFSPASCPGVITVGANGIAGKRAFYSNYGSTIALAAPGGGVYPDDGDSGTPVQAGFVWSAINAGDREPTTATYGGMAGTSQAAPHVSGTVAMMQAAVRDAGLPTLTPPQVRQVLRATARPFPSTPDQAMGTGIVDAYAAVTRVLGLSGVPESGSATPLSNNVPVRALSGNYGDSLLYRIDVPAGARNFNVRTMGGTGDVSLYVGTTSTITQLPLVSKKIGNTESYVAATPAAGTYYVMVRGEATFANVTLVAFYTAP